MSNLVGAFAQTSGDPSVFGGADAQWSCVAVGAGRIVMLSGTDAEGVEPTALGAQWTSDGGTTWNAVSVPANGGMVSRSWVAVEYFAAQDRFVGIGFYTTDGDDSYVTACYSDDHGETWALGSVATLTGDLNDGGGGGLNQKTNRLNIAQSASVAVCCAIEDQASGDVYALTTANGTSWSAVVMDSPASLAGYFGIGNPCYDASTDAFVAIGYDDGAGQPRAFRSVNDGATWTGSNILTTDDVAKGIVWNADDGVLAVHGQRTTEAFVATGASLASLTATTFSGASDFERMYWFGPEIGYVAVQLNGVGTSSQWAQSDDALTFTTLADIGQDEVSRMAYDSVNTNLWVSSAIGSTPLTGGSLSVATVDTEAQQTVTGLGALNGKRVSVTVDGVPLYYPSADNMPVVVGGAIPIPVGVTGVVRVGLPYVTDIQTLDLDAVSSTIKDRGIFVGGVKVWVENTGAFWAGPKAPTSTTAITTLERQVPRDDEGYEATELAAGVVSGVLLASWNNTGRVFLRQVDPVPLTVLAISPQGHFGGR